MKNIILAALIFIFFAAPGFSRDREEHKTVFFNLLPVKCPPAEAASVNRKIRDFLKRVKYLSIVNHERELKSRGMKTFCYNKKCALSSGNELKAHRVFIGSVKKVSVRYNEQLGKKGKYKYLLEEKEKDHYVISLQLYGVSDGSLIGNFYQKAYPDKMQYALNALLGKIRKKFSARKEEKDKSSGGERIKRDLLYSLSLSPSCAVPVGSLKDISAAGAGLNIDFNVSNLFVKDFELFINMSYHYLFSDLAAVKWYNMTGIALMAGYSFHPHDMVSLTPVLGGGYLFHILSDDTGILTGLGLYRHSVNAYYDPGITVRCRITFNIHEKYKIHLTPGYNVFFEKSKTGMYFSIDAGVKIIF